MLGLLRDERGLMIHGEPPRLLVVLGLVCHSRHIHPA